MLTVVPCTKQQADAFVDRHHRTHKSDQGGRVWFGVAQSGRLVAVCVIGRPRSRMIQKSDPLCAEVTRCCTDGTPNAASKCYANAWIVAKAIGYRRLITYTLPEEGGASLRALKQLGWRRCENENHQPELFGGGEWDCPSRPRLLEKHPTQTKWRWEVSC